MILILAAAALGISPALGADPPSTPEGGMQKSDARCPFSYDGAGTGTRGFAPGSGWLANLEVLQLTPGQREAIGIILDRYRTRGWDLAQRGAGIREQLTRVEPDDPGYADATQKASETAAILASDLVKIVAEARAEIHAVLTDEQRQRLRERTDASQKRWQEWQSRHKAPQ